MSRKTPSENMRPGLMKEIRSEFSGLFERVERKTDALLNAYPKTVFVSMVALIILSSIGAYLIPMEKQLKHPENNFSEKTMDVNAGALDGLGLLFDLGGRAKRITHLQNGIERLLTKEELTGEDSVFLDSALRELEYFDSQKQKADED